ncbi:MAG: succinate--CoA ligase subunit alpha [Chroococcales cyanobacterium]
MTAQNGFNWQPESKVIIQGITEPLGLHFASSMKAYGTTLVAGVSPGQGGQEIEGIPVFDLVEQVIEEVGEVQTSLIFVEAYRVLDAALEAIAAGIRQIILITGGIPPLDMVRLMRKAQATKTFILGPGSAGIIIPNKVLLGVTEPQFYSPGNVALLSRSDFLTYEVAHNLTQAQLGQSIAVNLGREGIVGSSMTDWLPILAQDNNTDAIVLIGHPNGGDEDKAAAYIASEIKKPVVAYIAGRQAPIDKPLGDASMIIAAQLSGAVPNTTTAQDKVEALEKSGVPVAKSPSEIPSLVKKVLKKKC